MTGHTGLRVRSTRRREKGIALVTALLIVALATIFAAEILWAVSLQVRRVSSALYFDQAFQAALGAEAFAAQILRQDLQAGDEDHRGEEWAVDLPPLPLEKDGQIIGEVAGFIEDMQGRVNLNNLVNDAGEPDEVTLEQLRRLFQTLEVDPAFAGFLSDWIDPDIDPGFPDGAEDDLYSGLTPPHRTANIAVTSISELYSMPEFNLEAFQLIAPYVSALPRGTLINANTTTAFVLDALSEDLDLGSAEGYVESAVEGGLGSLDEIRERIGEEAAEKLTLSSQYFRLTVRVTVGTSRLTMYSLLLRGNGGTVRTVLRSLGTE